MREVGRRTLLIFLITAEVVQAQQDLVLENVYEAALDLPRILFAVRRQAQGPVLQPTTGFAVNYAFLDTGASGILMSRETVSQLGILEAQGNARVKPAFSLPVGGVGQMTTISGYQIDRLEVPLLNGRQLVFTHVRLGVHDIQYVDVKTKTTRILDGVFGCNFLCASAKMVGLLPDDIRSTAFKKVVIDLPHGVLGLCLIQQTAR